MRKIYYQAHDKRAYTNFYDCNIGLEQDRNEVKNHFPSDLASSETADLFMSVIMYRLKENGRCAVILPDGFLFGTDNAKVAIKKKLFSEFGGSYESYIATSGKTVPTIVVAINLFEAFDEAYMDFAEEFLSQQKR